MPATAIPDRWLQARSHVHESLGADPKESLRLAVNDWQELDRLHRQRQAEKVYVRVNSHRAYDKLVRAIGREPQGFFSFYRPGSWRELTAEELPCVHGIKGLAKSKLPAEAMQYINW